MPKSFAELEKAEQVTATEVADALDDYAVTGAAISSPVVIALINRTKPDSSERVRMAFSAATGRDSQTARHFRKDAAAYADVLVHLQQLSD